MTISVFGQSSNLEGKKEDIEDIIWILWLDITEVQAEGRPLIRPSFPPRSLPYAQHLGLVSLKQRTDQARQEKVNEGSWQSLQ
jgi:hypothetical protein